MGVENTVSLFFSYLLLLGLEGNLQTTIISLPIFNMVRQKEKH
jgi:hypothetical protein